MKWVETALCMFGALLELSIYIALEPSLETDIFVCASRIPDSFKTLKLWVLFIDRSPSSCPKLRNSSKQLLRYGSGWMDTRPTTRFPTGDQYQWWIITTRDTVGKLLGRWWQFKTTIPCSIRIFLFYILHLFCLWNHYSEFAAPHGATCCLNHVW